MYVCVCVCTIAGVFVVESIYYDFSLAEGKKKVFALFSYDRRLLVHNGGYSVVLFIVASPIFIRLGRAGEHEQTPIFHIEMLVIMFFIAFAALKIPNKPNATRLGGLRLYYNNTHTHTNARSRANHENGSIQYAKITFSKFVCSGCALDENSTMRSMAEKRFFINGKGIAR